jgi:hypothetical protein
MLRAIEAATPEGPLRIRVTFRDGDAAIVDLSDLPARGGVFARLGDPSYFGLVAVAGHGRYLAWPGELEVCADSLWHRAHPDEPALSAAESERTRAA